MGYIGLYGLYRSGSNAYGSYRKCNVFSGKQVLGSCPPESKVCLNFLDLTNNLNCGNMSRRTDPYRMWVKGYWYGTIQKDDLEGVTGCHPVRHFCRVSRAKSRIAIKSLSIEVHFVDYCRWTSPYSGPKWKFIAWKSGNSKGFKICYPSKRSDPKSSTCCRVQNYFKSLQKCQNRHPVCN